MLAIEAYFSLKRAEKLLIQDCIFTISTDQFEEILEHSEIIAAHGMDKVKKDFLDLIYEKKEKTALYPALKILTENLEKIENYFRQLCSPTLDNYRVEQAIDSSLYVAPAA